MISGPEFTRAVRRSGLGNKGVADLLGVGLTTVHDYMKAGVRPLRTDLVLQKLGAYLEDGNPLAGYSNLALVAELARRLDRVTEESDATNPAPIEERHPQESKGGLGKFEGTGLPPE